MAKKTSKATSVGYNFAKTGYRVEVYSSSGTIISSYDAGNYSGESTTYVSPDSPHAVPVEQLEKWAKQTAEEMAAEHGLTSSDVDLDSDIRVA